MGALLRLAGQQRLGEPLSEVPGNFDALHRRDRDGSISAMITKAHELPQELPHSRALVRSANRQSARTGLSMWMLLLADWLAGPSYIQLGASAWLVADLACQRSA